MRSTIGYWRQAKNDLLPLPKWFSHLYGHVPGKRLSPKVQDLPGADEVTEGHGGMVQVFFGVDDGRQPGSTRPRRGDEMSVMPEWFQEQEQEEQEEREAKRRANLDEWRRIAKMLRDLEYIKVPVRRERDRGGIMICQYCGKPLQSTTTGDVCTNPACPGRLRGAPPP